MIRIAALASGRGTHVENIFKFLQREPAGASLEVVISDQPQSLVIERMQTYGLKVQVLPYQRSAGESILEAKRRHEAQILQELQARGVQWVCLCGYMRILTEEFLRAFHCPKLGTSRVVNIHPSLLPSFPGNQSYRQAFDYGVKVYGATLHFVDGGVDTGPILYQEAVNRLESDTFADFVARGMEAEYRLYRRFLKQLSLGTFERVEVSPAGERGRSFYKERNYEAHSH